MITATYLKGFLDHQVVDGPGLILNPHFYVIHLHPPFPPLKEWNTAFDHRNYKVRDQGCLALGQCRLSMPWILDPHEVINVLSCKTMFLVRHS